MKEKVPALLGQLRKSDGRQEASDYQKAVFALMEIYNTAPDEELFSLLYELLYVPNASAMCDSYERTRTTLVEAAAQAAGVPFVPGIFPEYDELPCMLFPIAGDLSVIFLKEEGRFRLHGGGTRFLDAVRHMLLDVPKDECLSTMAAALREQRESALRQQIFQWCEERNFPEGAETAAAEFSALSHDEAAPLYLKALLRFAASDLTGARELAEQAYALRPINVDIWHILIAIYDAQGEEVLAACFKGLCHKHTAGVPGMPLRLEKTAVRKAFCIGRLSPTWAPFYEAVRKAPDGGLQVQLRTTVGDFLLQPKKQDRELWCGIYNTDIFFNARAARLACLEEASYQDINFYSNITFDLRKALIARSLTIHATPEFPAVAAVTPLAEQGQPVTLSGAGKQGDFYTGKAEFGLLRLECDTRLAVPKGQFAAADPVHLGHSSKRKRLVLNLLLDGLSWPVMRKADFRSIPNVVDFFSKGVIFNQAFSVAEYTFSSLGTVETGLHMHRSQIFHDSAWMELFPEKKTLAERMKALGYYCVQTMGDSAGIYNGYKRGYDRIITAPYITFQAYEGVKRTIDHLEAFDECDNYVFLHVADSHPVVPYVVPPQPRTQAKLPWQERVYEGTPRERAFDLEGQPRNIYDNIAAIERMDRSLGELFRYIEEHYAEDEYIVNLYSDHGISIYSSDPFFFSDERCGVALMMRGAGIPVLGMTDELMSLIDLHAIVMHEAGLLPDEKLDANLPEVFGGKQREYVISNSIFPGQTYKLCIRTKEYEFRLETKALTRMDGTIDMSAYTWRIYEREGRGAVWSDALRDKFLAIAWQHVASFAHT